MESRYGRMKIWAPMPKMIPPMKAPARRRICFCREEPMVESAVIKQVATEVLRPGQSTAV
jgi:hypothetical protein